MCGMPTAPEKRHMPNHMKTGVYGLRWQKCFRGEPGHYDNSFL